MKVQFLVPPAEGDVPERVFGCAYRRYPMPPIFCLTAAAVLERDGHSVLYADAVLNRWDETTTLSHMRQHAPGVIVIYSVNLSKEVDLQWGEKLLAVLPSLVIVYMGPSATDKPDGFLFDERCYVVRGEPEYALRDLLRAIARGDPPSEVPGVSCRADGSLRHAPLRLPIEELDELPFPSRHLVRRNSYYNPKLAVRPFTAVLTSRGCSYNCIYCVPNSLSFAREIDYKRARGKKPPVRMRSPENVVAEFQLLADQGYRSVAIIDDNFTWGTRRTVEICEGIKGTGIAWGCLSRADHLNEEIVRAMGESGCRYVDIGVESFDEEVLRWTRKQMDVRRVTEAVHLLRRYGVSPKLNIILGSAPCETEESIRATLEHVEELDPDAVMFSVCNPFPGTDFYDIARREGWITTGDYVPVDVGKESIISYPHLTKETLEALLSEANRRFYLRPRFFLRNLPKLARPREALDAAKSLFRKLQGMGGERKAAR